MSGIRPRQPRLRASCDGCFLAKVKCSKGQPACQRCLTCGLVCHYSPSSRAGKPKAIGPFNNRHSNTPSRVQPLHLLVEESPMGFPPLQQPQPILQQGLQQQQPFLQQPEPALQQNLRQQQTFLQQSESNLQQNLQQPPSFLQQPQSNNIYSIEGPWPTPPASLESTVAGNPSLLSDVALFSLDDGQIARESNPMSATSEPYSSMTPWTPPTDIPTTAYPSNGAVASQLQSSNVRSHSFDAAMSMTIPWGVPSPHGLTQYSRAQSPQSMSNTYFSPASPTLDIQSTPVFESDATQTPADHGNCPLFNVCFESLQSLDFTLAPGQYHLDVAVFLNHTPAEECHYDAAENDAINGVQAASGDTTLIWKGHLPYLSMPN
ncbi:hypothetical protein F4861DRAFT_253409 [Xylaria intraflava]|nr:hypothetical protein F4861DRAFT_253409 [Xylaria intraflava]